MNRRKIAKGIKNKLIDTLVVLTSGLLIYWNISFVSYFIKDNEKLIWMLDIALFNLIVSVCFSILIYFYISNRTEIFISIKSKSEDVNKISLEHQIHREIYIEIKIKGKSRLVNENVSVSFPRWVNAQTKPQDYIEFNNEINGFLIDLSKIAQSQKTIDVQDTVTILLITNTSDYKSSKVTIEKDPISIFKKLYFKVYSEGIEIINKGE